MTVIQLMEYLKPMTPAKEKQEDKEERALGFAEALNQMKRHNLKPPTKEAEKILKDKENEAI